MFLLRGNQEAPTTTPTYLTFETNGWALATPQEKPTRASADTSSTSKQQPGALHPEAPLVSHLLPTWQSCCPHPLRENLLLRTAGMAMIEDLPKIYALR